MGFGQNSFASHAIGPQEAFVPVPEGIRRQRRRACLSPSTRRGMRWSNWRACALVKQCSSMAAQVALGWRQRRSPERSVRR
jgi:hypothetical protein